MPSSSLSSSAPTPPAAGWYDTAGGGVGGSRGPDRENLDVLVHGAAPVQGSLMVIAGFLLPGRILM
eukprot:1903111-Alexandrium_andersonii.AAC.1